MCFLLKVYLMIIAEHLSIARTSTLFQNKSNIAFFAWFCAFIWFNTSYRIYITTIHTLYWYTFTRFTYFLKFWLERRVVGTDWRRWRHKIICLHIKKKCYPLSSQNIYNTHWRCLFCSLAATIARNGTTGSGTVGVDWSYT